MKDVFSWLFDMQNEADKIFADQITKLMDKFCSSYIDFQRIKIFKARFKSIFQSLKQVELTSEPVVRFELTDDKRYGCMYVGFHFKLEGEVESTWMTYYKTPLLKNISPQILAKYLLQWI